MLGGYGLTALLLAIGVILLIGEVVLPTHGLLGVIGIGAAVAAIFVAGAQNPWAALPSRILRGRGHMPPPEAGAPGILALADPDRLRRLLAGAGFSDPRIEEVAFTWHFRDLDDYWDFLTGAAGAIASVLGRLEDPELRVVREQIAEQVASFVGAHRVELPAASVVASAS